MFKADYLSDEEINEIMLEYAPLRGCPTHTQTYCEFYRSIPSIDDYDKLVISLALLELATYGKVELRKDSKGEFIAQAIQLN